MSMKLWPGARTDAAFRHRMVRIPVLMSDPSIQKPWKWLYVKHVGSWQLNRDTQQGWNKTNLWSRCALERFMRWLFSSGDQLLVRHRLSARSGIRPSRYSQYGDSSNGMRKRNRPQGGTRSKSEHISILQGKVDIRQEEIKRCIKVETEVIERTVLDGWPELEIELQLHALATSLPRWWQTYNFYQRALQAHWCRNKPLKFKSQTSLNHRMRALRSVLNGMVCWNSLCPGEAWTIAPIFSLQKIKCHYCSAFVPNAETNCKHGHIGMVINAVCISCKLQTSRAWNQKHRSLCESFSLASWTV